VRERALAIWIAGIFNVAAVEPATAEPQIALDRRFPDLSSRLGRFPLCDLPTRVAPLEQLRKAAGLGEIWIKRDDESCRLYGGNKPRKLELLIGRARRRGRRTLMTFGGLGTHHGLATTICAQEAGLRTILVLVPQPLTEHVREAMLLDAAFGAEMHAVGSVAGAVRRGLWLYARGFLQRDWPELVPTGGTSALGTIGYVNAALELAEQVAAGELPEPDWIFVPLGSGGTVAGLVAGLKLTPLRTRVAGVLVTDILPPGPVRLASTARSALRLMRARGADLDGPVAVDSGDFFVIRSHLGSGYGAPTEEAEAARRLLFDSEGIELETTYSAKCLAALLAAAGSPEYRGKRILFWNTYSSVDPKQALPRLPDHGVLPREFRRFFE